MSTAERHECRPFAVICRVVRLLDGEASANHREEIDVQAVPRIMIVR